MSHPPLDLISAGPDASRRAGPPILLLHGAYAAAWCWEPTVMPGLAQQGFQVHALSFRGHGASGGHEHLHQTTIADFADDLADTVARLDAPPLVVGHSMGAFVLQKYLERLGEVGRRRLAGAMLLCPVPPEGLAASSVRLAFADPLLWHQLTMLQTFGALVAEPRILRRGLFSADVPDAAIAPYMDRFQEESRRAIVDMTWLDLCRPARVPKLPLRVVGADRDAFFPPVTVRSTAWTYGVAPRILTDIAHAVMLEPNAEQTVDAIAEFACALAR